MSEPDSLDSEIKIALGRGDLLLARQLAYKWLTIWSEKLSDCPDRNQLRAPLLWGSLADVVERTSDHHLIEHFWQILERIPPPAPPDGALPLLGIPILNRADLLLQLLDSLDHPVQTLAIVDNSSDCGNGQASEVSHQLQALRQLGHPLIDTISIARPFRNLGVAASWNLILSSFPEATTALLANNDVRFAPGVIAGALGRMDASRPQFLTLLPEPNGFSAFLLTALCWDRIGLFDASFHPAYGEDLDYRDRLRATPEVDWLPGGEAHRAMAELNPTHSATIASDPWLMEQNRASFALNRLWYFSQRRVRGDCRGSWRRLWLAQWSQAPDPEPTP